MKLTLLFVLSFAFSSVCFAQSTESEDSTTLPAVKKTRLRKSKVILYPNPAIDQFSIKTKLAEDTEIIIYNNKGQHQQFVPLVNGDTILIDVSNFDPGNYYIVIKNTETSETRRLVIKNH